MLASAGAIDMPRFIISFLAGTAAMVAIWSLPAASQPNPSEIDLGQITPFATEASAMQACNPDSVVWTDRKTGYYYPKFVKEYGNTPRGTFTCLKGALAADYWGWGVISNIGGHKGREFPDRFPCTQCM